MGRFETKQQGDPSHLISWYEDGADGQIGWGDDGDLDQCVEVASEYMDEDDARSFCELRHEGATGMTTAEHAAASKGRCFGLEHKRDDEALARQAALAAELERKDEPATGGVVTGEPAPATPAPFDASAWATRAVGGEAYSPDSELHRLSPRDMTAVAAAVDDLAESEEHRGIANGLRIAAADAVNNAPPVAATERRYSTQ